MPFIFGYPNILGNIKFASYNQSASGAFSFNSNGSQSPASGNNLGGVFLFDASRSNGLFGDSNTVQPASTQVLIIIKTWEALGCTVLDLPNNELEFCEEKTKVLLWSFHESPAFSHGIMVVSSE